MQLKPVALHFTSEELTTGTNKALVAERKTKGRRIGMAAGWGWEGRRRDWEGRSLMGTYFIFGAIDVIAIKLFIEIQ